jgi:hypothetical protein
MLVRQWLLIVESYYFIRASLIIYPKYFAAVGKDDFEHKGDAAADMGDGVSIEEELVQTGLALTVMVGIIWSYFSKHQLRFEAIKLFLFVQSI